MSVIQLQVRGVCILVLSLGVAGEALADVTIEEKSTIELPIFKAHANSTESFATERKRRDFELNCEGMMSMLCGKAQSGEIVRLDKSISYDLEPKKKSYRETALPSVAERVEFQKRMEANLEKMKQCAAQQPAQPAQPTMDTSKCQMSPAKVDVKNLGANGEILGHAVHHSVVNLTQSCTNKETSDVCDVQYGFDTWLTDDRIAGLEDRQAFELAYLSKMGLTGEGSAAMSRQVQQMMAPYSQQLNELKSKSGELKGQPLRTSFHMAYGGLHCAAASKASAGGSAIGGGDLGQQTTDAMASSAASAAASKARGGGLLGGIASDTMSAVGSKMLSGMFAKKKKSDTADSADTKAGEPTTPGMMTMVTFTTETTAIRTESVPADRFEIPTGWKKIVPKTPGKEEPFACPSSDKGD
ncbi:MAG: hypothetical protein ABI616_11000 [Pseudomonadota bacterium]